VAASAGEKRKQRYVKYSEMKIMKAAAEMKAVIGFSLSANEEINHLESSISGGNIWLAGPAKTRRRKANSLLRRDIWRRQRRSRKSAAQRKQAA
jgi:type IV secretory pathway VirB9-like protein